VKELSKTSMPYCALSDGEIDQNMDQCDLFPPADVRGMKVLDRGKFSKSVVVPWLTINEMKLGAVMKHLKKYLLKLNNFRPVQVLELSPHSCSTAASQCTDRRIVLNPTIVKCFDDIKESDRSILQHFNISKNSLEFGKLDLTYDNWRADELLKAVLPEDKDSLTSYSIIGHIVHVNLRDHLLDYKQVIGQILLDKIKGARTVVNKTDIIDNTYRNFKMEILCGEDHMLAQVRENHCTFEFDFSSVYWNPRLCTEHERIAKNTKQGDILYDVFAGVGPLAIPVAKKKCTVLANDLNPDAHKWLEHNAKLNKVNELLQTFNKDGEVFIKEDVKSDMLQRWQNRDFRNSTMHITMNLPAMAVTFLKFFSGLFTSEELETLEIRTFPVVYLYCFTKGDNPVAIAKEMVEENLGVELKENLIEIFHVRNVSVKKEMMRVTFLLSKSILTVKQNTHGKSSRKCVQDLPEEPQLKRLCVEDNGEVYEKQIMW
jgi:tRNA (guanine37-N1)-methyltransferase